MKSTFCLIAVWVLSCATAMGADPAPNAVQIGVGYATTAKCTSTEVGIDELGQAYFGASSKTSSGQDVTYTLQAAVQKMLDDCKTLDQTTLQPYTVVVFLARPTENAPQTTVVHFIYNRNKPLAVGSTALPGIKNASWIYVSSDELQTVASQLVASPIENPIYSQLGSLFGALEKPFEKINLKSSATSGHSLILHITPSVNLQYARSSIVETDSISVPKRDKNFKLLNADGKDKDAAGNPIKDDDAVYQQMAGNVTLTNTPKTIMTVNAAVGVLVGSPSGDQKMKIDNKLYAVDPLTRGMAMAGITFHAPVRRHGTPPDAGGGDRSLRGRRGHAQRRPRDGPVARLERHFVPRGGSGFLRPDGAGGQDARRVGGWRQPAAYEWHFVFGIHRCLVRLQVRPRYNRCLRSTSCLHGYFDTLRPPETTGAGCCCRRRVLLHPTHRINEVPHQLAYRRTWGAGFSEAACQCFNRRARIRRSTGSRRGTFVAT